MCNKKLLAKGLCGKREETFLYKCFINWKNAYMSLNLYIHAFTKPQKKVVQNKLNEKFCDALRTSLAHLHLGTHGHTRAHPGTHGHIRAHTGTPGHTRAHLGLCPGKIYTKVKEQLKYTCVVRHSVNYCHCSTAVLLLLLLLQREQIRPVVVVWNTAWYYESHSW